MKEHNTKRIFVKILKIFGWIFFSIVLLLATITLLIQLPPIQTKITQEAISFLEKKIGTEVSLQKVSIRFPKTIVVEGLYLEDKKRDTLLYMGRLDIDTDLWALTRKEIQLNDLTLENTKAYISRPEADSAYNFTYILNAFVSDSTSVPDTTQQDAPGWKFSIEDITLQNIKARYHDLLTGNIADLNLGLFEVSMDEFDLDRMRIVVDEINLENTTASVLQTKQPEVTEEVAEENQPITYDIGVGQVNLENIHANFHQQALGQLIRMDLGRSSLETDKVDLKGQIIDLDNFLLENTFISYHQRPVAVVNTKNQYDPEPAREKQAEKSTPWKVTLSSLELSGNSIQFYDFTKSQTSGAMDFNHLWISGLEIDAEDIALDGTKVKCDLNNLAFRERSGFMIESFKAGLNLREDGVIINDLLLLTGNSRFEMNADATFASLETIADDYPRATINANINNTSVGLRDLLYFNPMLKDSLPLKITSASKVFIDASVNGAVNNIKIDHLTLRAFADTYLRTKGTITGLPDAGKLKMDIFLDKFYTTKNDIGRILPDPLIPSSIDLPEWINLHGTYAGSMTKSNFNTILTSSVGEIDFKGKLNLDSASASRGYNASLNVKELNVGKILKQPETIGKLNLEANADAQGLSPEEMNGTVKANVKSFDFKGYHYANFVVDGKINQNVYNGTAKLQDKNLDFVLAADLNYKNEVPRFNITFDLKNADFKALNLAERPLKARGILSTKMATPDFKSLNGNFGLRKVAVFNGETLYAIDSLLFASIDQKGRSELAIESDLLSGKFAGTFNIFEMGDVLQEFFGTYYSLKDTALVADKKSEKDSGPQNFRFNLKLKKTELLTDVLLPELTSFVPGEIRGEFDSEARQLDMKIDFSKIQYANIGVKSFLISANSDRSALNYNVIVDQINLDSMRIDGLEFNGTVANNSILTNLVILDSLDQTKYLIGGTFQSLKDKYQFKLLPNQVKLNYTDWSVPEDNYFQFGGPKLLAHNVIIQKGKEQIIIDSKKDAASTLFVGFRELNLEHLVSMVAQNKTITGLLHGDINIVPDTADMTFTADVGIRNFNIANIPWGDISLAVGRKSAERFDLKFGVRSKENNLNANGYYITGDQPSMNVITTIERFNLTTVEPLTMGQLKDLKGFLTGDIKIEGTPQAPKINGSLNLRDMSFYSTYVKTAFSLKNETIGLTPQGISFDSFELQDERKNTAVLDGMIQTTDYKNFAFNLDFTSTNFRLLNTTEKDNDLFYGKIDVDAVIRIRGNMDQPNLDVRIGLSDESNLTYIVPQTEAGVMEQQGIVRFKDKTFSNDPFMKSINPADTVKSTFTGINLTAQIELTDKETFNVIIDPTTGDQLSGLKGNATLTLEMDPTGNMDLTGRYEITEGKYSLSFYKFVKREFSVARGSTLTFTGDPLNADMDLSAIFEVETSPIDLVAVQIPAGNQTLMNQYKQKFPFQVYLNIQGQLLKPEISFRLDMLEKDRNALNGVVYSKLQDVNTRESDLNKQVFALLILKRFISDNPLESEAGGGGLEGTARSSVSKILTSQLNRLSQNVRGVELSFDVKSQEDYSSGQAENNTELELGLSKSLLNDKLTVKVAGNVDVEGDNSNRKASDYIGDLALEYMLTDDGRIRITGFRNSNYDIVDGELTETGAGLIYIKDYNTLSELFKANEKENKK
ncbi:translocation/assembly module TamB domain-containing protein [Chryseosolibacter indicus]|uniref:Translocation/assembly module TamB domain-containing protein n=1 Tax=Chryseosolibacter indicus TaxID=2782351 RepID=A0ABS5VLR3_9BACT|nr:translocation/assembly module TamB domain-containing protein [Chryseosolibacter indicus]MBT1701765.1 translocation/assembly module TamB domain-containing protein [Chryseosolibacter indicus]